MSHCGVYLQRGKDNLSRHRPDEALHDLRKALEDCPAHCSRELSSILFYLGIALKKLGSPNGALRCWITSQKVHKKSHATKMVERFANWYGMEKQTDPQLDDWKAFFSIQLARYLEKKSTRKLGTVAERDMITDLIYDYWKELKKSGILEEKEYGEKLDIFKEVEIIFPSLVVPDEGKNQPIPVDFRRKQHVNSTDRCHCGSGLPYSVCCGRTPGLDELECGIF